MKSSFLERKDRIILTTIDVMNEFGFHSVSTKEIAAREQITEAAVFKHFPKKNDLFLAVLDYYSKYDSDIYESIKIKNMSPLEAIIYYEDIYSSYYQSYPAITSVTASLNEMMYNSELAEKVQEIINTRISFMKEFILKAQENGDISDSINADILVDIFIGTRSSIYSNWRMANYSFSLKERSNQAIMTLLNTFNTEKGVENNEKSDGC